MCDFCEYESPAFPSVADYPDLDVEMRRYFPERTCRADLTEANELVNINTWECSLCGKSYEEAYGSYEFCPHCGARIVEERR